MISLPQDIADKALSLLLDGINIMDNELPTEGRPADRLIREIEKLKLVIAAFQDHVQNRILHIRRQQNLLSPIYRLPDELLVEVFLMVNLSPPSHRSKFRDHQTLAVVSSWWRSTAISCPRLWKHLSSTEKPKIVKLMLERSKLGPLDLWIAQSPSDRLRRFLDLVVPHMARWKSLFSPWGKSSILVSEYLVGKHLPSLEILYLVSRDGRSLDDSLDITSPLLKRLINHSPQFPLRLEHGLHSKLTELQFTACMNGIPFNVEQYYTLLSSAPSLEVIGIQGCSDLEQPNLQSNRLIPVDIHLPKLRYINLSGLPSRIIGYLIASISTAPDCYLNVTVAFGTPSSFSSMFLRSSIPNSLFEIISSYDLLHAADHFNDAQRNVVIKAGIRVMGPRSLLYMGIDRGVLSVGEVLRAVIDGGCFPQIKYLEIIGLTFFNWGHVQDIFHQLPHLESIQIRDNYHREHADFNSAIRMLASPPSDHFGQWRCPNLRSIALDTLYIDLDSLTQLIIARTSDIETSPQAWCNLQRVELSSGCQIRDSYEQLIQLAAERRIELQIRKFPEL